MKKIGMPLRRAEVEALMRAVDENSDGKAVWRAAKKSSPTLSAAVPLSAAAPTTSPARAEASRLVSNEMR